jgi:hypothetical protein
LSSKLLEKKFDRPETVEVRFEVTIVAVPTPAVVDVSAARGIYLYGLFDRLAMT